MSMMCMVVFRDEYEEIVPNGRKLLWIWCIIAAVVSGTPMSKIKRTKLTSSRLKSKSWAFEYNGTFWSIGIEGKSIINTSEGDFSSGLVILYEINKKLYIATADIHLKTVIYSCVELNECGKNNSSPEAIRHALDKQLTDALHTDIIATFDVDCGTSNVPMTSDIVSEVSEPEITSSTTDLSIDQLSTQRDLMLKMRLRFERALKEMEALKDNTPTVYKKYPVSKIYPSGILRKVHNKHVETLKKLFVDGVIKPDFLVFAGVEDDNGSVALYDGQHRITAIHELNSENHEKGQKPFYSGLITVVVPSESRGHGATAFKFLRKELMSLPFTLKEKIAHVRQIASQIELRAEELAYLKPRQLKDIFHTLLSEKEYPEYVVRLGILPSEDQRVMESLLEDEEEKRSKKTNSSNYLIHLMRSFLYARSRDRVKAMEILKSVASGEKEIREAVRNIAVSVETELIKKGYNGYALKFLVEKIPNTAHAAKAIRRYRIRAKDGKMSKELFYEKIMKRLDQAEEINKRIDIRVTDVFVEGCDLLIVDDAVGSLLDVSLCR
ncbi:hypothetical protein Y032_0061g3290 [Ancylostoma ceylanicum]|uniref:Uncharacterized protein n=1 Tax=Ancylostoma ceylanicum TaxID=53326 RepID=A0A016U382_9BILA|nr:hypothetical protein Y032_0061g3290 [Ancylostoma ceylanicum]